MSDEETPEKFPREVRKYRDPSLSTLEDIVDTESGAARCLKAILKALKKNGIELPPHAKVLEIGSGNSTLLSYMQKQGLDAFGVEVRPRGEPKKTVAVARAEQLPFADGTFFLVITNAVFDRNIYLQDQPLMLQEIKRVLQTHGIYAALEHGSESRTPPESVLAVVVPFSEKDLVALYRKD